MKLKILQFPNEILMKPSREVTSFDEKLSTLIDNMIETSKGTDNCVGLAAVQVGIPLRVSVIKSDNKFITIINPKIIYESGVPTADWEGCMSVGENEEQLFSKIYRDSRITVKYFDKHGKEKTRVCKGFLSHAFQHEIDHMNGILFLKYVKDPADVWKDKDLTDYYNKHNRLP